MAADITILVVDDDQYLLDLLIETLKTIGYQAIGVSDAQAALRVLADVEIHLVITDIKMPGMSGVEFAQEAKAAYPHLPVIFITGVFGSSILQEADADGFLSKPFRIGQMEELIKNALARARDPEAAEAERILVVDDDDVFRLMLVETLKLSGYAVEGAADSAEAISLLDRKPIGAVITDVKMPGMDGISLAKYIKRRRPDVPVILITGYFPASDDISASEKAADGFLMKPFRIESITELLENLKKQRLPRAT